MMDMQELLAKIEAITAKDVEVGLVLRELAVHVARLERAAEPKKEANSGN